MREWMHRNARPLEWAEYQYYFEGGDQQAVLEALGAFQNDDGGFGHGLEPDCMNPNSSPIQTWRATTIIRRIGLDKTHPMVTSILNYLEHTPDQKDGHYPFTIPSNDDYPRAPWWSHSDRAYADFNPTASLTGFILRYGDPTSNLFKQAMITATEVIDHVILKGSTEMHELNCILELMEDLMAAELEHFFRFKNFREALVKAAHLAIERDVTKWPDYVCTPSKVIRQRDPDFYHGYEALMQKEMDFLEKSRDQEGVWDIQWSWGRDAEVFPIARLWWKGILVNQNLRLMKTFKDY